MKPEQRPSDFEIAMGMTYDEAKKFLISTGRWENVEDQDGYTIIATAKYWKEHPKQ
jgi:hypothetical protein